MAAPSLYVSAANDDCLAQDIELANQILDEAGWVRGDDGIRAKDGVRLEILYQTSTNSVRQKVQAMIKQWWKEIGVETELRNISPGVFFSGDLASPDTYGKFYADIEMFTNSFLGTDPEPYMGNWLCTEISDESNQWLGNNIPRYCNEEYDGLMADLATTAHLADRAELVKALNDMLVQDDVIVPLIHRSSLSAHANDLSGVRLNSWDSQMWNIADWSRTGQSVP